MVLLKSEYSVKELNEIDLEFKRITEAHYLDHAGTTLYSDQQIKTNAEYLSANLFCNPHSSKTTEDLIDQVRFRILKHFNTDSSKYNLVFTSGTTNGLKTIAECFNFRKNKDLSEKGCFCYVKENHTSVLGMREIVKTNNIMCIDKDELLKILESNEQNREEEKETTNSLLVISAQCNFSGYKIPLKIIDHINSKRFHRSSLPKSTKWYICLDAASFASTNYLDLKKYKPDFICISFYKLFGYPTGLGALLVSKDAEDVIDKKYYGGGTVKIALSGENWHQKRDSFHEKLEDGTIPFLSIISLLCGFNTIERLVPAQPHSSSMKRISRHTFQLGSYLFHELKELKYKNGMPVIKLYCDTDFQSFKTQGGIVNFNVLHEDGSFVGFAEFSCMASIHNIYIRTGCFCNPGACQKHLKLTDDELRKHYKAGKNCGDSNDLIDGIPTGSVRVSIGYMTKKENIDALISIIKSCYMKASKINLKVNEIKQNYKIDASKLEINKQQLSSEIKLKTICVYPIKSCGSMKISTEWPLNNKGLLYDREWLIVKDNGIALTQKTETKMCLIKPKIDLVKGLMELTFPGMDSITVPIDIDEDSEDSKNVSLCQSKVCGDLIEGKDCGDKIASFLSNALNISGLRLLRQTIERHHSKKKTDNSTKNLLAFSNQAQFLLINESSVKWLANKIEDWSNCDGKLESIVDRFRGNLIIETKTYLEEINWKTIMIGNTKFKVEGHCTRCQMICIDQNTGNKTTEPLRTIAKEFQGKMRFGIYLSQVNDNDDNNQYKISCNEEIHIE